MVPVGGRPRGWRPARMEVHHGSREVAPGLGHQGRVVEEPFLDGWAPWKAW